VPTLPLALAHLCHESGVIADLRLAKGLDNHAHRATP